jgi:hypothetical protein
MITHCIETDAAHLPHCRHVVERCMQCGLLDGTTDSWR